MTGDQMRELRKALKLGKVEFGRALGYNGNNNTVKRVIYRYEAHRGEPIPDVTRDRVAKMMQEKYGSLSPS